MTSFILGMLVGAVLTFIIFSVIANKRIDDAYKRGFRLGQKRFNTKKGNDNETI